MGLPTFEVRHRVVAAQCHAVDFEELASERELRREHQSRAAPGRFVDGLACGNLAWMDCESETGQRPAVISPASGKEKWGGRWDSNPRQPRSQPGALPTELRPPSNKPVVASMARPAGVEPATTGLEGRCSIQLSYGRTAERRLPDSRLVLIGWSGQQDSNLRPSAPKADALPDCAMPRCRCHPSGVSRQMGPADGGANHTRAPRHRGQFNRAAQARRQVVVPPGLSSRMTPAAASSSRIRSDSAQFLALRAASARGDARFDVGIRQGATRGRPARNHCSGTARCRMPSTPPAPAARRPAASARCGDLRRPSRAC